MVAVPVLSPRSELEWAKPPNVLAGIHTFGQSRLQMQKTVHEGLHVKTVDQADRAYPEQAGPAEQEVTKKDGSDDERDLKLGPNRISLADQIRTPLLHRRWFPLIQPSQMRPPESAVAGAGDILDRIGFGMVISMVRDPRVRRSRPIKDRSEDEHLLDNPIEFHCSMGEPAVVRHRRP